MKVQIITLSAPKQGLIQKESVELLSWFIQWGSDKTLTNKKGNSPRHIIKIWQDKPLLSVVKLIVRFHWQNRNTFRVSYVSANIANKWNNGNVRLLHLDCCQCKIRFNFLQKLYWLSRKFGAISGICSEWVIMSGIN